LSRGIRIPILLASADADGICQSQTPGAAGNLTINGALATAGVATLATVGTSIGRQLLFTSVSDESGKTITLTGTDTTGNTISDSFTGPNTTATSTLFYVTVTQVAVSAAFTGAVTVGTNGVGATSWVPMDSDRTGSTWSLGTVISGTANVMPQATLDPLSPGEVGNWMLQPSDSFTAPAVFDLEAAALTASKLTYGVFPVHGVRLLINSGATSGTFYFDVVQQGLR